MAIPPFRIIQSNDRTLQDVQQQAKVIFDRLTKNPLFDGNFLQAVSLVQGSNRIAHGLGRNFVEYLVSLPTSLGITLQKAQSPDASQYILINASGNCTVSIYVF